MILHRICRVDPTHPFIASNAVLQVSAAPVSLTAPVVILVQIPGILEHRKLLLIDLPGFSVLDVGAGESPSSRSSQRQSEAAVRRAHKAIYARIDYFVWVLKCQPTVVAGTLADDELGFIPPLKDPLLLNRLLVLSTAGDIFPSPTSPAATNWKHSLRNAINSDLEQRNKSQRIADDQIFVTHAKGYSFLAGDWSIESAPSEEWWTPLAHRLLGDLAADSPTLRAIDDRQRERNQSKARLWFKLGIAVPISVGMVGIALVTAGSAVPGELALVSAICAPLGGIAGGVGIGKRKNIVTWLAAYCPPTHLEIERNQGPLQ